MRTFERETFFEGVSRVADEIVVRFGCRWRSRYTIRDLIADENRSPCFGAGRFHLVYGYEEPRGQLDFQRLSQSPYAAKADRVAANDRR